MNCYNRLKRNQFQLMKSKKAAVDTLNLHITTLNLKSRDWRTVKCRYGCISRPAHPAGFARCLESSIIKTEVKQRALKSFFEKSISKLPVDFLTCCIKKEGVNSRGGSQFIYLTIQRKDTELLKLQLHRHTLFQEKKKQLQSSLSSFGKIIHSKEVVDPQF